ncbi:MAG: hypothetical protein OEW53_03705, partial [Actinomycetota bacterium]|nr:hypothetical protein [Actinomycetota bacterium]
MSPRTVGVGARLGLFLGLSMLAGVLVAALVMPAVGLVGLTAQRGAQTFEALPAALQTPTLKQR